jgi:hypothetical protein
MSALGHKQTYAVQKGMSALPPIATAKAHSREKSCRLYPRKQTCAMQGDMSAKGQFRDVRGTSVLTLKAPDYTNSGCLILLATVGNSNWKIEPPFARGDTQIRPSWFSMID